MSSRGAGLGGAILRFAAPLGIAIGLSAQTGIGEIHLPMQALVWVRGQKAKLDQTVTTSTKNFSF